MNIKRAFVLLSLALLVLVIDYSTKAYTHAQIPLMSASHPFFPYGGIGVFQNWHGIDFSINHAVNKGAAWGMMSTHQHLLHIFRIIAIGCLIVYLFFFNKVSARQISIVLVIIGASGNVIDYFIYGHVVDMIHFRFWNYTFPIFNIADSSIFCGVALLFLQSFFAKYKAKKTQAESIS